MSLVLYIVSKMLTVAKCFVMANFNLPHFVAEHFAHGENKTSMGKLWKILYFSYIRFPWMAGNYELLLTPDCVGVFVKSSFRVCGLTANLTNAEHVRCCMSVLSTFSIFQQHRWEKKHGTVCRRWHQHGLAYHKAPAIAFTVPSQTYIVRTDTVKSKQPPRACFYLHLLLYAGNP